MIADAFFSFLLGFADLAYLALPPWTPTVDASIVQQGRQLCDGLNHFVPVYEVSTQLGIVVAISALIGAYKFVMWVVNIVRGAGA